MVPLSSRVIARTLRGDQNAVDALLARARAADTPYQAWAAVALVHAGDVRHHQVGRAIMNALRTELPTTPSNWEHGDVACFAVIADDALTQQERRKVAESVPPANDATELRARFYSSPLYVYLTARGLAGDLPDAARFAALVAAEAAHTAARPATDLPSLILQLATALELTPILTVNDSLLRAVHARIVASVGEPEGAIAIRWLLEHYIGRWPSSRDAVDLRKAAERYAAKFDPTAIEPAQLRPEVAVMRLETLTAGAVSYRLVRAADVQREVAANLRHRHLIAAGAYAASLAMVWGGSAWVLVAMAGVARGLAWGIAFVAWAPSTLWATLWEYGRLRRDGALAGTIALCLCYYSYIGYVALTGGTIEINFTRAMEVIAPVVIGAMFGAAPAIRSVGEEVRSAD